MKNKTSIPKIRTVRPKIFEVSELRKELHEAINISFDFNKNKVVGYSLTLFMDDEDRFSAWQKPPKMNITDMPDKVRNSLLVQISKQA